MNRSPRKGSAKNDKEQTMIEMECIGHTPFMMDLTSTLPWPPPAAVEKMAFLKRSGSFWRDSHKNASMVEIVEGRLSQVD